jgi:hypothetical protein
VVAAAVMLVLVTAGAAAWFFARRGQLEREHRATAAQVEQLADAGRYVDVWRVAGAGLQRWPDDPGLQRAFDGSTHLVTNLTYACALARIRYWVAPAALPEANDVWGHARYWKDHYNTHLGAGRPQEYVERAMRLVY